MNQSDQVDPLRQNISALADGELDSTEAQRVIDALVASDQARDFWSQLHAAGDCLRSEETGVAGGSEGFMERFSALLAAEPVVLAPRPVAAGHPWGWLRYGLPGASIAAAIAMVLWMAIPQMTRPEAQVAAVTAPIQAQPAPPVLPATLAPAPVTSLPAAAQMDPEQVGEYLTAHQGSVQAASLTIIPSKADTRP
jgi:negative regulator of sigma E activity